MSRTPTPAEVACLSYRPPKRCVECGVIAPLGCLCDACAGDGDWTCRECLEGDAIAADALLTLEEP